MGDHLRERMWAYEANREQDDLFRGLAYGITIGAAIWTVGLLVWWVLA